MGQCIWKYFKPTISSDLVIVDIDKKVEQTEISSEIVATPSINKNDLTKLTRARIVQNFTLIWLDSNIDESNIDFKHSLTQLRRIVNRIDIFTKPDQCIDFLNQVKNENVFMLISGGLSQVIIPLVHHISQLDSIYIFCVNLSQYEQWPMEWTKVKGVFTQIELICDVLKRDTQQCDRDSILISVTSKDFDRLEPSFMYTQLLKEILLDMEYDENAKTKLVQFCRKQFSDNVNELQIINEFERDYHIHTPIWWYTCECFTYQLLNRALRTQDVQIIIIMGFFLRDVHQHLKELHSKINRNNLLTVYRGKSMSKINFEEIKMKKDGLLAFNTFLSTSLDEKVALQFAQKSLKNSSTVGVLFQITVDPSISSTPFAPVKAVSAIPDEEEILFSMHTIFRIGQITLIEDRLWRIELALTSDDDQELKRLTEHIRKEMSSSEKWERLGSLLIKMGNFDEAEEIFHMLLEQKLQHNEKMYSSFYYHLGEINYNKGNYKEALEFYQKSLEIRQKYLDLHHSDLASTYNNIGLIHDSMGEYSKALEFYQKSLEIGQNSLLFNSVILAETYNNIGAVYFHKGEYSRAVQFYQKSLEISLESLPPNHPDLATVYNNIAQGHHRMAEYSKALDFYQKTIEIQQKSLPSEHPDLAIIYNNIGLLYCNMGQFSKAFEFYDKDLKIKQKSLPQNHPSFAFTYNNIGLVHSNMGEYHQALQFYQKSLEISLKSLPSDHSELASTYNNIGLAHNKLKDYSNALKFLEMSLNIKQQTLPSNHPDLATTYNNIGVVYWNTGEYLKALPFYERAVEIGQQSLPENHPYQQWYQQLLAELRTKCNSL